MSDQTQTVEAGETVVSTWFVERLPGRDAYGLRVLRYHLFDDRRWVECLTGSGWVVMAEGDLYPEEYVVVITGPVAMALKLKDHGDHELRAELRSAVNDVLERYIPDARYDDFGGGD